MAPIKSKHDEEPTIQIHGNTWLVKDIMNEVLWCLSQNWRKEKWRPTAALVHKQGGRISQYLGQRFDPEKIELVSDGWNHDHCSICWWTLHESDDRDEGEGYLNEANSWLCTECYLKLIRDDALNLKSVENPGDTEPEPKHLDE